MKPERYLKVYNLSQNGSSYPYIRLYGKWLQNAGFETGYGIKVDVDYGKLTITSDPDREKKDAIKEANRLRQKANDLERLVKTNEEQLSSYLDRYNGYRVRLKLERENDVKPYKVACPEDVYSFFKPMQYEPREKFLTALLDSKGHISGVDEIAVGNSHKAMVSPAEVFKTALMGNAYSFLLVHNHPSGDPKPSTEDIKLTKELIDIARKIDMQIRDHLIIGYEKYTSFYKDDWLREECHFQ